jgi:hypothetical protein
MGLESANYVLAPRGGVESVPEVLASLGAEERSSFPGTDFPRWVLRNPESWIDVMAGNFGAEQRPAVSVRIALSNPVAAHAVLRRLLSTLLEHVPGLLLDKQSRRTYAQLDDESWYEIEGTLDSKRADFQRNFGPFEAAISGEDVFSALRSRNGNVSQ